MQLCFCEKVIFNKNVLDFIRAPLKVIRTKYYGGVGDISSLSPAFH